MRLAPALSVVPTSATTSNVYYFFDLKPINGYSNEELAENFEKIYREAKSIFGMETSATEEYSEQ